jgi:hypothetical protein
MAFFYLLKLMISMKLKKILMALLPVIAAAVAATSCQDDDSWKPVWALPLVKEQAIRIGDFITDEDVAAVNEQVKKQWNNYVQKSFGLNDTTNVDSIAFLVLANDVDSTYITFQDSVPVLNESIKEQIRDNLQGSLDSTAIEKKIAQINGFLEAYWAACHGQNSSPTPSSPSPLSAKAKGRAITKSDGSSPNPAVSGYYGGAGAINGLLDAMIHPTDIFVTAANLLTTMGYDGKNYIDSINAQIDAVLQRAAMTDSIAINFADYVGESSPISSIELYIATKSDALPFDFGFKADFVDANSDSIRNIFTKDGVTLENSPSFDFKEDNASSLNTIVEKTEYVKFSVKCQRTKSIDQDVLRTLSQKGISFSARVKVQSAMSKLTF